MAFDKAIKKAIQDAAYAIISQNLYGGAFISPKEPHPKVGVTITVPPPKPPKGFSQTVEVSVAASLKDPICKQIKAYCDTLDERSEAEITLAIPTVTIFRIIPNWQKKYFPWIRTY